MCFFYLDSALRDNDCLRCIFNKMYPISISGWSTLYHNPTSKEGFKKMFSMGSGVVWTRMYPRGSYAWTLVPQLVQRMLRSPLGFSPHVPLFNQPAFCFNCESLPTPFTLILLLPVETTPPHPRTNQPSLLEGLTGRQGGPTPEEDTCGLESALICINQLPRGGWDPLKRNQVHTGQRKKMI